MAYNPFEKEEEVEGSMDLEMIRDDLISELKSINEYEAQVEMLDSEDAAARLRAVTLQHRHAMPLPDGAEPEDLAHANHALPAESGDEDLGAGPGGSPRRHDAVFPFSACASISALTRAFMSRMIRENSGRLLEASCLMPVCQVKSVSVPSALRPCVCS